MGTDKAFLTLEGYTLLSRTLDLAQSVTPQVRIVGAHEKFRSYGEVIEDVLPSCGPLGGIHAALRASRAELNLVLAVDTPFLSASFLQFLALEAQRTDALVTVPQTGGHYHPLCAVYRRDFCGLAECALRAGRNRIDRLFTPENTRVLSESELAALSFPASMFDNLNTREDFARAEAQMTGNAQRE